MEFAVRCVDVPCPRHDPEPDREQGMRDFLECEAVEYRERDMKTEWVRFPEEMMPADAREVADEMAYRFEGQGHGKAKDELTPVIAALLLAREALEAVEWEPMGSIDAMYARCHWCRAISPGPSKREHRPDCRRERALAGISGVLRYTKGEVGE
jgi:hypothetical protein